MNKKPPIFDVRSFKAIDFLLNQIDVNGNPLSILDLGCGGGPTHAWQRNWSDIDWLGFDGSAKEIQSLQNKLPKRSESRLGFVYSKDYCQHLTSINSSYIEIGSILQERKFDFVKVDVDGCDLHLLQAILDSPDNETILGIEIEVTYTSFRNSEVNFHLCADLLLKKGFEPIAIENARRYASDDFLSPYVWDIEAQSAMGLVFQANQTWIRKQTPNDKRSKLVAAVILASYGLTDWAWASINSFGSTQDFITDKIDLDAIKELFIPTFLSKITLEGYERALSSPFMYAREFASWRAQAQNREIEQPWFLSN
jgi:hypothetical protein